MNKKEMEKQGQCRWKKVCMRKSTGQTPVPRWGHTCCVIEDEMIFFGGYADSNYMNDMWSFKATTMQWREIKTTGDVPLNRSNCTMNYDAENNRIIIFGGGGSSKKRFNTLSILDWSTKQWLEIKPRENEPAPWERTYHSAEFLFPYLVIFGGEGLADLDDLWVFNFLTLSWKEVHFPKNKARPCARRFHSSALIKNEMFVIGGCHSRYRSLNDVYSLDLRPLLETGDASKLEWRERKLEGSTFLTRWGHTSTVLGDKIYVFAGRFSNDLNDLLMIDLNNNIIRNVKGALDAPIARRRHCAAFMGSSLLVFGGFNGEYFNDLHYITLQESKTWVNKSSVVSRLAQLVNNPVDSDSSIQLEDGQVIYLHKAIMMNTFGDNESAFNDFIEQLKHLPKQKALELIRVCYLGLCESAKAELLSPSFFLKIQVTDRIDAKSYYNMVRNKYRGNELESNSLSVPNESSGMIKFRESEWEELFTQVNPLNDLEFRVHNKRYTSSRALVSLNSEYFNNMLSGDFLERSTVDIRSASDRIFKVLLKFMELDIALIPDTFTQKDWIELLQVSKYYSLERLANICEYQLSLVVSSETLTPLLNLAVRYNLENLKNYCVEQEIRRFETSTQNVSFTEYDRSAAKTSHEQSIKQAKLKCHKLLYFELQQKRVEFLKVLGLQGLKKELPLHRQESEKENSEINS